MSARPSKYWLLDYPPVEALWLTVIFRAEGRPLPQVSDPASRHLCPSYMPASGLPRHRSPGGAVQPWQRAFYRSADMEDPRVVIGPCHHLHPARQPVPGDPGRH